MKWFRFYSEFVDDPKIAMMSDSDQLMWVKALCLANEGGIIALSNEEICWKLRCALSDWERAIHAFQSKSMINFDDRGIVIANWEYYSPPIRLGGNRLYAHHQNFVFHRDGFKCVYCGTEQDLTLDHVMPQSRGGSHDPENLATCCSSCNSSKGARTPLEWKGE